MVIVKETYLAHDEVSNGSVEPSRISEDKLINLKTMQIKSKCCGAGIKRTRHANADSEVILYQCHRCGNECEVQELLQDVPMTEVYVPCSSTDHWFDIITTGKCERCQSEMWWMAAAEDEQMKHREFPSDEEIDAMSEHYEKLTAML